MSNKEFTARHGLIVNNDILIVGGTNVIAAIVASNANAATLSSNVNTLAASFVSNSQSLSANVNVLAATFASANANNVSLSSNVNALAAAFVSNSQSLSSNVNTLAATFVAANANAISLSANVNTLAGAFVSNSQTLSANVNTLSSNVNSLVNTFVAANANAISLSANVNILAATFVAANANAISLSANVNTLAATFVSSNANAISLSANVNVLAATFATANANNVSLSTNVNTLAANVNTLAGAAYPKTGGTISGDVSITGNLTISGNQSYINTQTLLIGDSLLTLNADLPGNITPTENAGIEVNRGSALSNSAFIWNETAEAWQFTSNTTLGSYSTVASLTDVNNAAAGANNYAAATYGTLGSLNSNWNVTNTAYAAANQTYSYLLSNWSVTNTAYNQANSGVAIGTNAYAEVNSAFTVLNAAYTVANASNVYAATVGLAANNFAISTYATISNSQSLAANVNTLAAAVVANDASQGANIAVLAATFVSANANAVSLSANVNTLAGAYATTRDSLTSNWAVSNLSSVIANSAFIKANNALANTSGVTFDGNLTIDGNTTVLGTVLTSSGVSSSENGVLRIVNPGGAANSQALVSITGAIKIRLPAGANNAGVMMRMTVQIYDYAGTNSGTSRSLEIGGYNYAVGNWYNIFATQQTMGGGSVNVRFGYDSVSECIWIGETSTTWYYPRVAVTDFMAGNATLANFQDGWRISFETAFDTVEQTIVAAKPIDVVNYTSYAPSLTTFNAANANTVSLSTNVNVLAASFVSNSQTLSANVNTLAASYVTFTNIFSQANANAVSLSANVNTLAAAVVANDASQGANIAALAANVNTIAGAITNLTLENVPTAFVKRSVTAATTANIALYGTQTIDGVAVSAGNRVLVKDQTLANQNGLYVVSATAWSRSADADVIGDIASALVAVDAGTTNGGKLYDNDIKITDTLGTTNITWYRVIDDGAIYTYAAPVTAYGALNVAYLAANTNAQTLSANVNTLAATFVAANANNISLSANVNTLAATFVLANANSVSLSTNVNTLAANVNTLAAAAYNKSGGTISGDVSITGSLTVSGTQSYINTQTLLIGDNLVVLNADLPGNITPTENAGLEVNRGNAAANAALIWVEAADAWAFTNNANAAITTYIASNTDIATLTSNTVSLSTNVNILAAAVVSNNATQGANIAALAAITTANTVGTRFLGTANNADLLDGLHWSYFLANTSGTSYNGDIFVPAGNLSVGTTNTIPSFRMQVYDASNAGLVFRNPSNYTVLAQSGSDYYLDLNRGGSAGNFVLRNSSNLNEQFRVDSKGSVGIGTASPLGVLDLGGGTSGRGIVWGGAGNHYASIWTPYSASGLVLGTAMKGNTYADTYDSSYGGGAAYRSAIRLNYTTGGIQFFANGSQTISANTQFTPQEVMRITETGNVSIGQTTAPERLNVYTDSDISASIGKAHIGYNGYVDYAGFSHIDMTAAGNYALLQGAAGSTYLNSASGQVIYFRQGNVDKMILDASSNVGIGTVSPLYKLEVNGTFYTSNATHNIVHMRRISGASTGINWYSATYTAWQDYMAPAGASQGWTGTVTAPTGTYVTSWARRSFIENNSGYGWTWEAGTAQSTTPTIVAELSSATGNFRITGGLYAVTKSFEIKHPTKPGMKLRYGSLEGPENGVYVRGRLDGDKVINLPDYWEGLVDLDTITVNLTAIGHAQNLYVSGIDGLKIHIDTENHTQPYCFYHVYAERKDVEKLIVEYEE